MRWVRAVAAAGVVLFLLAGIPLILAVTIGNPLAGWSALQAGDLSDSTVLDVLAVLAWLVWAQFTWVLVREAVDLTRQALHQRRRLKQHPAGRPMAAGPVIRTTRAPDAGRASPRVAARALLMAALMAGPLTASAQAWASPPMGSATATAPLHRPVAHPDTPEAATGTAVAHRPGVPALNSPGVSGDGGSASSRSSAEPRVGPMTGHRGTGHSSDVTVVVIGPEGPRTWWALAETVWGHGHGQRWRDIWELNAGRTQVDGQVLRSPRWLDVGWKILVPHPDPAPSTASTTAVAASTARFSSSVTGDGDSTVPNPLLVRDRIALSVPARQPSAIDPSPRLSRGAGIGLVQGEHLVVGDLGPAPAKKPSSATIGPNSTASGREPSTAVPREVRVREPHGSAHDSLWRIARRELGSGRRWPEIFRLNVGARQPDGQQLLHPARIRPGWVLRLPAPTTPAAPTQPVRPGHSQPPVQNPHGPHGDAPTPPSPEPGTALPVAPTPARALPTPLPTSAVPVASSGPPSGEGGPDRRGRHQGQSELLPGIELPSGGFVGLGLAAAISAVAAMARSRRRRRQTRQEALSFHLADTATFPAPEAVVLLEAAHRLALGDLPEDAVTVDEPDPDPGSMPKVPAPTEGRHPHQSDPQALGRDRSRVMAGRRGGAEQVPEFGPIGFGTGNGREIALDLEATAAVGLVGPGAEAVARALTCALLARVRHPRSAPTVAILIPHADAVRLFGAEVAADPPPLLSVVSDLEHAMDRLEVDMLARRRLAHELNNDNENDVGGDESDLVRCQPAPSPRHVDPYDRTAGSAGRGSGANPGPASGSSSGPASGHSPDRRGLGRNAPMLVLVATTDEVSRFRLQAVLDLGRGTAIAAILLGAWPTGPSYSIEGGGRVIDRPDTRLYTLTRADTIDLIDVIRDAFSPSPASGPASPSPGPAGQMAPTTRPALAPVPGRVHPAGSPAARVNPGSVNGAAEIHRHPPGSSAATPTAVQDRPTAERHLAGEPVAASPMWPESAARSSELATGTTTTPTSAFRVSETVLSDWEKSVPAGPWAAPVTVRVLGQLRLMAVGEEVRHGLRGKTRELLMFLLLNPAGASSDTLADALWPDSTDTASALRSAMKRLRAQLRSVTGMDEQMFIMFASGRYRPDRRVIVCDAWEFEAAIRGASDAPLANSHLEPAAGPGPSAGSVRPHNTGASAGGQRLRALREAVALYGGTLLDGVDYSWVEPYRQALRQHALQAFVRYATAVTDTDPESALAALERALVIDPVNETLYRRVMLLQAKLDRPEAVAATLDLLRSQLADIDERPERQTLTLAATLSSHNPDRPHAGATERRRES